MVKYRWILTIDGVSGEVNPVWKDDLSIDYEHETGQQFFRKKLSGKINFVAEDADRVINAPFYSEFLLVLQKSVHNIYGGISWAEYLTTRFYKTDCIINEDDKKVSVQPTTKDVYNDVINGLEKEYNLMELGVEVQPIQACKRPMFQIYTQGESIVSCLSGGSYFERNRVNENETPENSHFGKIAEILEINCADAYLPEQTFGGLFHGVGNGGGDRLTNSYNYYYCEYYEYTENPSPGIVHWVNGFYLKDATTGTTYAYFEQRGLSGYEPLPTSMWFRPAPGYGTSWVYDKVSYNVYGRMVLDVDSFDITNGGQTTHYQAYPITDSDIVETNANLKYCYPFVGFYLMQSFRKQATPTKWGKDDNGQYFLPPDDIAGWYAVGRSQWVNTSMWTTYTYDMGEYEKAGRKKYTIKDCYPMSAVIKALLAKIAPNVTHDDAPEYSTMFYNDQYAVGVPRVLRGTRPMFAPKSNVLIGEYQQPAQKAPITLKMVTDMLAKAYGCYWFVDDSNRFRIEHITYFKYGGSYRQSDLQVGIDLTAEEQPRNEMKWAFGTSEYQFDKQDMAARFQYSWMDDVTDMFKGQPVDVISPFVTQDKVEDITIANFTTDLDLMLLSPDDFSKDGFALLHATNDNGTWMLPFETIVDGLYRYTVQGYRGTMWWLERNFLLYDMPSWSIRLGDTATTSSGIKRLKKQNVVIPMGTRELDTAKLVKTYLGNGQFEKISLSLLSRMAKATLKYDTYENNE